MELAYIDKLDKDNNGVKYFLVRQDLFDGTVDAKGMKTNDSKETFRELLTMITKRIFLKKFGLTREQNLLESLKNYAELKEYKVTLQWVRPRPHLLKLQYDPLKYTLWLHGRHWIQVNSQIVSIRYDTKFSKKLLDGLDTRECKEFQHFVHSVQQTTTRN